MTQSEKASPGVGCAVSTTWADLFARRLIERAGARAIPVTPRDFLRRPVRTDLRALVYDLSPWSDQVVDSITVLRQRRPEVPILLYVPPTADVFALVPSCGTLANVRLLMQERHERGIRGLEHGIEWLLRTVPASRLFQLVKQALVCTGPIPSRLSQLVINQLAEGFRPSIAAIAYCLHMSVRTLQRTMATHGLPPPKEFVDWMTLLHIQCVAQWYGTSQASVARKLGMDANEHYRLRKRLLKRARRDHTDLVPQGGSPELVRFASWCGGASNGTCVESSSTPYSTVSPSTIRDSW